MLHRGKAHTYGLEGPFGIAYGASCVWFVLAVVIGGLSIVQFGSALIPQVLAAVLISWLLGLIAFCHRRTAWKLFFIETLTAIGLASACLLTTAPAG